MSCLECDKAQEPNSKSLTHLNGGTYIRVEAASILIVGCKKHLEQFMGRPLNMIVIPGKERE